MLEHSAEIGLIAAALAKAQGSFGKIVKDTVNPFFKMKYAPLSSVIEATRKALSDNKIAVVQSVGFADGLCSVDTMLLHDSGQWMKGTISMPVDKNDPQRVGSASTYARRYGLSAFVNVAADDDDDGNAASKPGEPKEDNTETIKVHLQSIEESPSVEQLKKNYQLAYKWATSVNDREAITLFSAAKDGRKKVLESPLNQKVAQLVEQQRKDLDYGDAHEGD